eukprot:TRINITY_DN61473_c0_g1_i1.p1 TRINITY_DN61473_c0_g1~~TRINITY_DN61473_c0_g1_i1.p1  ORF type:complete len:195 (+),score=46.80 TRINITY_DN61473_c0_g1_i1:136-720(+)
MNAELRAKEKLAAENAHKSRMAQIKQRAADREIAEHQLAVSRRQIYALNRLLVEAVQAVRITSISEIERATDQDETSREDGPSPHPLEAQESDKRDNHSAMSGAALFRAADLEGHGSVPVELLVEALSQDGMLADEAERMLLRLECDQNGMIGEAEFIAGYTWSEVEGGSSPGGKNAEGCACGGDETDNELTGA